MTLNMLSYIRKLSKQWVRPLSKHWLVVAAVFIILGVVVVVLETRAPKPQKPEKHAIPSVAPPKKKRACDVCLARGYDQCDHVCGDGFDLNTISRRNTYYQYSPVVYSKDGSSETTMTSRDMNE